MPSGQDPLARNPQHAARRTPSSQKRLSEAAGSVQAEILDRSAVLAFLGRDILLKFRKSLYSLCLL